MFQYQSSSSYYSNYSYFCSFSNSCLTYSPLSVSDLYLFPKTIISWSESSSTWHPKLSGFKSSSKSWSSSWVTGSFMVYKIDSAVFNAFAFLSVLYLKTVQPPHNYSLYVSLSDLVFSQFIKSFWTAYNLSYLNCLL